MKKKILYIVLLTMMMLTACGKSDTDKKDPVKTEQEGNQKTEDSKKSDEVDIAESNEKSDTTDETTDATQADGGKITSTEKETVSASENEDTSNNEQKTTGSNTQKSSNNSTTTPSNGSANTGSTNTGSNTTETKKPVKRVSEEVKSAVAPYKYGITKYDVTTNYYTLYSDGSKEFLDSDSYTVYDSSNYSATDSQLKSESDSNASKYMSYYQEVLRLVNEIRAEVGVAPLTLDTTLCKAASMRALEMDYSNQMSHTRPSGKDCFSVLDFYGISFGTCGENIAAGQTSAASVVKGWKNSPGHYQNMINASFTKLGVGYSAMSIGDYGHYWCQLFTN